MLGTAQAALVAIDTVPTGATLSVVAMAAAAETLFASARPILIVTPGDAAATQLVDDRPLWWSDHFHVTASAALSYALINPSDSTVLRAGIRTGATGVTGTVGATITPTVAPQVVVIAD